MISFYIKVIGEARGGSLVVNMILLLVKPVVSVFHSCSSCQESQREPSVKVCLCKATFVHDRFCVTEADLQGQRLWCVQLERKLNEMRAELIKENTEVDHALSNNLIKILGLADTAKITPFMTLFCQK